MTFDHAGLWRTGVGSTLTIWIHSSQSPSRCQFCPITERTPEGVTVDAARKCWCETSSFDRWGTVQSEIGRCCGTVAFGEAACLRRCCSRESRICLGGHRQFQRAAKRESTDQTSHDGHCSNSSHLPRPNRKWAHFFQFLMLYFYCRSHICIFLHKLRHHARLQLWRTFQRHDIP